MSHAESHVVTVSRCSEEAEDVAEVQRLRQTVAAAAWAAAASRGGAQRWGAYASHAEWRSVANRRRDAAAPQGLFLADLLQALRDSVRGCWGVSRVSMSRDPLAHLRCSESAACLALGAGVGGLHGSACARRHI